jgi:uncharacterized protein YecT (DUF1311 family)
MGFLIGLLAAASVASASPPLDCSPTASDEQRAACLRAELDVSDQTINDTYGTLRSRLDDAGRLTLRTEQRAWIHRRDAVCRLDNSQGDRSAWLARLSQDYAKTVCVVRFTSERVQQLTSQLARMNAPPGAAPPTAAPAAAAGDAFYDLAAATPRLTGKWYFETTLDVPGLAQANEQSIFIGVKGQRGALGTLQTIRKRDLGHEPRTIGVAVDLDNGKLYVRTNGDWGKSVPDSSAGMDVKPGQPYRGLISSSVALNQTIASGRIRVNFGAQPFVYPAPAGYAALDSAPPVQVRDAPSGQ